MPFVADGYADDDTKAAAGAVIHVPEFVTSGITYKTLAAALSRLAARTPDPAIGLVLGAGFEDHPELVAALEGSFRLIGNSAAAIKRCKDPDTFFATLSGLGIRHPETQRTPPARLEGWLAKRIGGSGGRHVHPAAQASRAPAHTYFQRVVPGDAISVLGVVSPAGDAFAFSRQWTSPTPSLPFRYGGATGPLTLSEDLEARLIECCLSLAREFSLVGLVSFDFLIDGDDAVLIEVNPRPGATLDVFDDASGTLFAAHVTACCGGDPAHLLADKWQPPAARSVAYLYADAGPIQIKLTTWPEWVMDRPSVGTHIRAGEPIATVCAEAAAPDDAERLCSERIGQLHSMLYDSHAV